MALSTLVVSDPVFAAVKSLLGAPTLVTRPSATSSAHASKGTTTSSTPFDIYETDTSYELYLDAPGINPEGTEVQLHGGVLTVSGTRTLARPEGAKVWHSERASYSFARSFTLPEDAQPEGITASLDSGVLRVVVPKRALPPRPEPKRIAVTLAGR